jgi:hypothetical protein
MRRYAWPAIVATLLVICAPLIFAQPSNLSATYLPMVFGRVPTPTYTPSPTATFTPTPTQSPTSTPTIAPTATPTLPPPSYNNCQADPNPGAAPNYPVKITNIDKVNEVVILQNTLIAS